jgi:hypothetical protein
MLFFVSYQSCGIKINELSDRANAAEAASEASDARAQAAIGDYASLKTKHK